MGGPGWASSARTMAKILFIIYYLLFVIIFALYPEITHFKWLGKNKALAFCERPVEKNLEAEGLARAGAL